MSCEACSRNWTIRNLNEGRGTCQFDVIVLIEEDVLWLDVSVDDGRVSGMQVGHCLQDLLYHLLGGSLV
jgi:hypothetical protein